MKKLNITINFDLDGTLANLYGVEGWLPMLEAHDETPYVIAEPLLRLNIFARIINKLQREGYRIAVLSWLSKNTDADYDERVTKAKLEWLEKYNFPYDEIHLVKYGTTKANCTRKIGGYQILIDDNEKVRKGWNLGDTINANENILKNLEKLVNFA